MVMDREASSWALQRVQELLSFIEGEYTRPSVLFKPTIRRNGPLWQAEYGQAKHGGVYSLGSTPDEAMRKFDDVWMRGVRKD